MEVDKVQSLNSSGLNHITHDLLLFPALLEFLSRYLFALVVLAAPHIHVMLFSPCCIKAFCAIPCRLRGAGIEVETFPLVLSEREAGRSLRSSLFSQFTPLQWIVLKSLHKSNEEIFHSSIHVCRQRETLAVKEQQWRGLQMLVHVPREKLSLKLMSRPLDAHNTLREKVICLCMVGVCVCVGGS